MHFMKTGAVLLGAAAMCCNATAANGGAWARGRSIVPQPSQQQLEAQKVVVPSSCNAPVEALRGGSLLGSRVMTWQTALKYKAGLLAETSLLLAVLGGARKLVNTKFALDPDGTKLVDFAAWALIIFGSDGIVGLLRKLQVKLGWSTPRITLVQAQSTWYNTISKPSWTPADWVFPAVWIPLKILQVFAARIVWVHQGRDPLTTPIVLFVLHQAFGDLWNTAFFRERYIAGGLSIIYQFAAVLAAATYSFHNADRLAGALMIPTCVWLVVACSLNQSIYNKNKPLV